MTSRFAPTVLCLFVLLTVNIAPAQDNWIGPYGSNWNNAGNWSLGLPGPTSDAVIYSGGYDLVYLDTSPTINSLQLGGAYNGTYSELTDGGVAQTLGIAAALNIGQTGYLYLTGGTAVTAGADSVNAGNIELYNGSSVTINGNLDNQNYAYTNGGGSHINVTGTLTNEAGDTFDLYQSGDSANVGALINNGTLYVGSGANMNMASGGVTDVVAGSTYQIYGTFTVGGVNSFFNSLNSIEGTVYLANGQTTNITPGSGTLTNSGIFDVSNGSTVSITGNVLNNYYLTTAYFVGGGNNTLNISGTLTNNSQFYVYGSGDVANVGTLVNNGDLIIEPGATLNLTTQLTVTDVPAGATYEIYGTFNAGANNAFATLTSIEGGLYLANGQTTNITPGGGVLTNTGTFAIGGASTVSVTGDVINNVALNTGYNVGGGNNTLNISGTLTNNYQFYVYGNGDVANVGTFVNNSSLIVNTGATLNLTNQPGGVTDVPSGSTYEIYGTFNAGANSAFAGLTSIEGDLYLANGQTTNITPSGGTLTNSGIFAIGGGSTVSIIGDVLNNYYLTTGYFVGGGNNTLNISGTLTNNSQFYVYGNGAMWPM